MVTEYYNYQILELSTRNHQEQVEYLKKLIEYQKTKARKDAIEEVNKIIDSEIENEKNYKKTNIRIWTYQQGLEYLKRRIKKELQ